MEGTHLLGRALSLIALAALVAAAAAQAVTNGRVLFTITTEPAFAARSADCVPVAQFHLFTVRADGTGRLSLGLGDTGRFSPDGRRLAITSSAAESTCVPDTPASGLFLARPDGTHRRRFGDPNSGDTMLGWATSAHLVAETGIAAGGRRVFDGVSGRTILILPGRYHAFAVSCGGRVAALRTTHSTGVGFLTVFWRTAGRTAHRRLSTLAGAPMAWSPDGRRFVFLQVASPRLGAAESLWVWDVAAGQVRRIWHSRGGGGPAYDVAWSRDGRFVVLHREASDLLVRATGGIVQALPAGSLLSPDGRLFVVVVQVGGRSELRVARVRDGRTVATVARAGAIDDWQALGRPPACGDSVPAPIP